MMIEIKIHELYDQIFILKWNLHNWINNLFKLSINDSLIQIPSKVIIVLLNKH